MQNKTKLGFMFAYCVLQSDMRSHFFVGFEVLLLPNIFSFRLKFLQVAPPDFSAPSISSPASLAIRAWRGFSTLGQAEIFWVQLGDSGYRLLSNIESIGYYRVLKISIGYLLGISLYFPYLPHGISYFTLYNILYGLLDSFGCILAPTGALYAMVVNFRSGQP